MVFTLFRRSISPIKFFPSSLTRFTCLHCAILDIKYYINMSLTLLFHNILDCEKYSRNSTSLNVFITLSEISVIFLIPWPCATVGHYVSEDLTSFLQISGLKAGGIHSCLACLGQMGKDIYTAPLYITELNNFVIQTVLYVVFVPQTALSTRYKFIKF